METEAQTPELILKKMLGNLMMEVAVLTSKVDQLQTENAKLLAKLEEPKTAHG